MVEKNNSHYRIRFLNCFVIIPYFFVIYFHAQINEFPLGSISEGDSLSQNALQKGKVAPQHHKTGLLESSHQIWSPSDWVARGGVWDFSEKIIRGQGTFSSRPCAYYKEENYSDFVYEISLKSLCDEDGSYGMLLRFDEKKDVGYVFSVWPHGDYQFCRIENEICFQIVTGSADYLKDQLKTWNTLKVACKGPQFTLYINDHLLVVAEDTKYKSGKIGLSLGHGPASVILYEVKTLFTL